MRISTITIGAAFVAAAALSACAGRGVVPSQNFASSSGTDAMIASPQATATPNPCQHTNPATMYLFGGSCTSFTMKGSNGLPVTVYLGRYKAYQGIKITTVYGKNTGGPATPLPFVTGDATGKGDITGKVGGKAFLAYGGKNCLFNGKLGPCPGKVFVYAELINNSNYTLKPADTPTFTITDTNKFPGTTCFPAEYTAKGWEPQTTLDAKPDGDVLHLPSSANNGSLYYNKHAQFIVAGVCE
jgi:hypothetical protein